MPSRKTKDELLALATEAQRAAGVEPTPDEVSRYLDGVLSRMDQKPSREKREAAEKAKATEEIIERRDDDGVEVYRRPLTKADDAWRPPRVDPFVRLLLLRIDLLRAYPDWFAKLKCVNPLCLTGAFGYDKQAQAVREVVKICDASSRLFGDWRIPKAN